MTDLNDSRHHLAARATDFQVHPRMHPSGRIANRIVKCRREPGSCTKRQVRCCGGTGQSAEHFYEFLREQQANIIQVPLQAYAQVLKAEQPGSLKLCTV